MSHEISVFKLTPTPNTRRYIRQVSKLNIIQQLFRFQNEYQAHLLL